MKYEDDKSFEHAVVYVLLKRKGTKDTAMREILYMSDIYNLLLHNETVTGDLFLHPNSYELSDTAVYKVMHKKNQLLIKYKKVDELDTLSDCKKISLDFAINRYNTDFCILPDRISTKINH
jgi:hypothetical protein